MKNIKTQHVISQDGPDFLDVDCYARYKGKKPEWCQRVFLARAGAVGEPGEIGLPDLTTFSAGPDDGFEQVEDGGVPNDILAALAVKPAPDVAALVEAARALVQRWDGPTWGGNLSNGVNTAIYIDRLRAALAAWEGRE
jgi:hypothetical protein